MMTIKGILILILIELLSILSVLLHYLSGLYVEKQLLNDQPLPPLTLYPRASPRPRAASRLG